MTRLLTALTAAMVLTITSVGIVAATDHNEVCESPDAPGSYFCRIVYVTLVPDADINAVLDRLIPGADLR